MPRNVSELSNRVNNEIAIQGMQHTLRQAIFDGIKTEDVTAIVKKQVELAKGGDTQSLQFVMKYVLGFGQQINLKQINVNTDADTAKSIVNAKSK